MLDYTSLVIPALPSFECISNNNDRINITKVEEDNGDRLIGGFLDADDIGYRQLLLSSSPSSTALSLLLLNSIPLEIQEYDNNDNIIDINSTSSLYNYIIDDKNVNTFGSSLSISSTLASLSLDDFDDSNEGYAYTKLAHRAFDIKRKKFKSTSQQVSDNIFSDNDNDDNNIDDNDTDNNNVTTTSFLEVINLININDDMSVLSNRQYDEITSSLNIDDFNTDIEADPCSYSSEAKRMIDIKHKPLKHECSLLKYKSKCLVYGDDDVENVIIEQSFQPSWEMFTDNSLEDQQKLQKMIKFDDLCDLSYSSEISCVDSFNYLDFADSVIKFRKQRVMKSSCLSTLATLNSASSLLLSSSSWDCKYIPSSKALDRKSAQIKSLNYIEMAKSSISALTTLKLRNLKKVNYGASHINSITSSWLKESISNEISSDDDRRSLDTFILHAMNTFDRVIDNLNKENLTIPEANDENFVTPIVKRHLEAKTESVLIISSTSNGSSDENRRPQKLQRTENAGKYVITEILAPFKPIEVPHTPAASRISSDTINTETIVDLTDDDHDHDHDHDDNNEIASNTKTNRNGNRKHSNISNETNTAQTSNMPPPPSQSPRIVSVSRLTEPDYSSVKDDTEYFGIQENEGLESMVSSYLQLHTHKNMMNPASLSTFSNKNKLQTISKVIETNTKVHQEAQIEKRKVNERNQEIPSNRKQAQALGPVETNAINNFVLQGLQLIISEDVVENSPQLVVDLSKHFGIFCLDAHLEQPISIIVDFNTAVSFLPFELLFDRGLLKSYVRTLTKQAFKFETIWILIMMPTTNMPANSINSALLTLCSAISKFPLKIIMRQVKLIHLSKMIFNICQSSSNDAILASNCCLLEKYIRRPFLTNLNTPSFSSLCLFLSKFPTINFMTAAFLLHSHKLSELVLLNPNNLKSQSLIPVVNEDAVATFLGLINAHIGLEKRNVPAPPPLNDNLLASDIDYSENYNQEYETPSKQQNYYDTFVNRDNDDDLVAGYPQRLMKKPRYNRDGKFFDYNRNDEYAVRNEMDMEMESDVRWNSNDRERDQQQDTFYNSSQLTTPTAYHNNRISSTPSPLIRPAHHHLGIPDKNINLVYESTDELVDKSGRKQTKLAFKKNMN